MLNISDLRVTIGPHTIVDIENLSVASGTRLGIVGESGSGKTMTAMSIVGLLPDDATVSGSIRFQDRELVGLSDRRMAEIRGRDIGVVFQDPAKALNPMMRIGRQVAEAIRLHMDLPAAKVRDRVVELLTQVHLPDAAGLLRRYPHQLSGGQQQRVLIAMAIACDPKLLIADEPTTALDVTVQNGILDLLRELSEARQMALIFVSHDLGVIQAISDTVAVVYGGQLVEYGPTARVIARPRHRYTQALVSANPGIAEDSQLAEVVNRRLEVIPGSVPALGAFPAGCRFRGRCAWEVEACSADPVVSHDEADHFFKCWNPTASVGGEKGELDVAR
ncbi:MAG TPA: ABC transporter ATP-binding protein [Acidimicrobiia bacterium]|nr:ABC transporter ATP-binding protein [Acidimicrobiia bacterium]